MKVLLKKNIISKNLVQYAHAERNIMATIRHPFIVPLCYAFQTEERLFLVTEYCQGGDLSQYLEIERKFPEQKAKLYLQEILLALEELHDRNILYRDLKPDNVVVDNEGHVLLTDFGLSKEGVHRGNHGANSFCGSYAYLSPEVIRKQGHGKAVDCYLLGVIFYEMLFALPPFIDNNKQKLFQNILHERLTIDQTNVSPQATDLLNKLLEKDPRKRLGSQSIKEVRAHPYFWETNWKDVYERKIQMPKPYLSDMARKIIKQNPYSVTGHPSTQGKPCPKDSTHYFKNWFYMRPEPF